MKILVIFTGGTIGSSVKGDYISKDNSTSCLLIEKYLESSGDTQTRFETKSPYYILSENLSEVHLNLLIDCVKQNLAVGYDGIIVCSGTDTLQYVASSLTFSFANAHIPILLVSSNYPLKDRRSNGLENFTGAVEFIKQSIAKGVFASYKNIKDTAVKFHYGTKIIQFSENSSNLFSLDDNFFAEYQDNFILNKDFLYPPSANGSHNIKYCENPGILVIQSMPADSFCYYLDKVKAIILRPYHSGTINSCSKQLKKFCREAKNKNIPIFIVNAPSSISYDSTRVFSELGVEKLPDCTFSAVYMKCWAAISLGKEVKSFVMDDSFAPL